MKKKSDFKILDSALDLLIRRGDGFVTELEKGIEWAVKETKGKKRVEIETAVSLTDTEKDEFRSRFPEPVFTVKPEILGGFRVTIGDWKLDATIESQIERMKHVLKENV